MPPASLVATLALAPHLSSVPLARHWANEHCGPFLSTRATRQVVELLTTELVVNAVLHGAPPVSVEVACSPGRVRVSVSDRGAALPRLRHVPPEATGGRGIALVDELAGSWGSESTADGTGKTVWFCCSD